MLENNTPKISVIMPFYNAKDFLAQAIESILSQTFIDFELILINDASTDNSDTIVKKYLSDKRIVYIDNKENKGIVFNLNRGLEVAKTEIIARMDGDDVAMPTRLQKQFDFLQCNPDIDVVGSFVKLIDQKGKEIDQRTKPVDPEIIKDKLIVYSPLVHPSVMFRKQEVLIVGGYRKEYIYVEDVDLWYRLAYSGYKISNVSEFLLQYRLHPNSTAQYSRSIAKKAFLLRKETIKKFNLKIGLQNIVLFYFQFIVGFIFPARIQQFFEGLYKKLVYHEK